MARDHVLALDQGTTSSRAIIYNAAAEVVGVAQQEITQSFPQPGWVEHDALEIRDTQLAVAREAMQRAAIDGDALAAVGITNQRETTILWERATGTPIHPAIVWQDRRTMATCQSLRAQGLAERVTARTGLLLDPYFSATKIQWLLEHVPGARERAEAGELAFGTVDSWLAWNLTAGRDHITDAGNASRTLLFNIHTLDWDPELLELFDIPASLLPRVVDSSGELAMTDAGVLGAPVPIAGIAGDQQAAMFGQRCTQPGMLKCTYGTGCFLTMNTGAEVRSSSHGLLATVAWRIGARVDYALEGSVFMGGAAIQWLRDGLRIIADSEESEALATSVKDTGGVVMVPALTGLGAPYWDEQARGTILGITRGTERAHIVRATLEGIAYQVNDVIATMEQDTGTRIDELRIDGGATANNFLVQFQADIAGAQVLRPANLETTAFGAAALAGVGAGLWDDALLDATWHVERTFRPQMNRAEAASRVERWHAGVSRARDWPG